MRAFESVYTQHRDAVLRFAIRCVGRRDVAEEITADAFLQLLQNWATIDTARLPAWLLTVVKNRATDFWRRTGVERRHASEDRPAQLPATEEPFSRLLENPTLKPIHRICLTLRYVQEMTVAEIADYLGLSQIQVKGHLQYSRGLLRKQLTMEQPHE